MRFPLRPTLACRPRLICIILVLILLALAWWQSRAATVTAATPPFTWMPILAAILPFLLAQSLRALRLFLLIYDRRMHFGEVVTAHFMTVPLTQMLPFKLGELLRIGILGCLLRNPSRAILAVWTERIYDIVAVLLILVWLAVGAGHPLASHSSFIILAGSFLLISFSLFFVIPENLSMLKRYLLTREDGPRSLQKLQYIDRLHAILKHAADVWWAHWATVTWLSAAIWLLEVTWLWTLLEQFGGADLATFAGIFSAVALQDPSQAEVPLTQARWLTVDLLLGLGFIIAASALWVTVRRRPPQLVSA